MKNEFCTYEQTLALKELGFEFNEEYKQMLKPAFYDWEEIDEPLIQQAFRFLREKYGLNAYIRNPSDYWYNIEGIDIDIFEGRFDTYEEAEQACLNKIIELAKDK